MLLSVAVAVACAFGCSVDERPLDPAPPFEPIGSAGGGSDTSDDASWQGCDDTGAAGEPGSLRCWAFDTGTEGWVAEDGVDRSFSQDDANGDPASGSLTVTNADVGSDTEMVTAGAYQCLSIPYADKYTLDLDVLVPSQPAAGGASIDVQFVNVLGCQGIILADDQFPNTKPLVWHHLSESGDVPRGTRSVLVRLLVGKFHNDPSFFTRFDRIRVSFE